jgi:Predicted ATPase
VRFEHDASSGDLPIPNAIERIVAKQLQVLTQEEERVLAVASLINGEISAVALADALGEDLLKTEECCERLVRIHGILKQASLARWPDRRHGSRYVFRHAAYRIFVNQRVPLPLRVRLMVRKFNAVS